MYNVVKIDKTNGKVATGANLATLRDGSYLFYGNTNVTNWTADMPNLVKGNCMFQNSGNLASFSGNLQKLHNGSRMFYGCRKLKTFKSNFSSLTNGYNMFILCPFTTWAMELPQLQSGSQMFQETQLVTFIADLPKLTAGSYMFNHCYNLMKFRGTLSSLSTGGNMFDQCKLDARSVLCIISSIPTWASGSHPLTIGCGCSNDDESKDVYAQEIGYESFTALNDAFIAKGWTVTWQFNGPTAANYSLRNPRLEPKKVFAKINEIDEDVATYTDGEKFYNLDWGHVVNDDSYEEFESFEAALEHFNLTEINRNLGDERL